VLIDAGGEDVASARLLAAAKLEVLADEMKAILGA
jgi:hypothetical protein